MSTEAGPTPTLHAIIDPAKIEAEKRKDARVDALVRGLEDLEKKVASAEAEGPGSAWKAELHRQSIEAIKRTLKDMAE